MTKPAVRLFFASAVLACALLGLGACSTVPAGTSAADWLGLLPADSSYLVSLNAARTKDLLRSVLKKASLSSPEIEQALDFTDRLYCGVKIEPGGKPAVSLILLGNYPLVMGAVLAGSKELEEVKGDPPFWRYKKLGLEIALPRSYMLVIAKENVAGLVRAARSGGRAGLSTAAEREMERNDFTLFFPLGLDEIIAGETGLSLPQKYFEEIWIGAARRDNRYYLSGVFNAGPDVDAQSFKKLLQFFILALLRRNEVEGAGGRLAEMKFSVEGRMIKVSDFYFTRAELEKFAVRLLTEGLGAP